MFDIGFSEIVVCGVVALIVIGPERMPEAVRTVGLWFGRMKRSIRNTREEIERQIGVEDIRQQLRNEEILENIETARRNMENMLQQNSNIIDSTAEEIQPRIYTSEPDLPDHAHMDEQASANTVLPHNDPSEPPKPTP